MRENVDSSTRRPPTPMRHLSRALLAALAPLLAAGALAPVAEAGYLCCNMRTDGCWISDIDYEESGKTLLPLGTPLKFTDYSRDLTKEAFAARYIQAANPRDKLASAPAKVRTAVESAKLSKGMTREQVVMAVGYPVTSENPSLVAKVTGNEETLAKVYLE